MGMSPHRYSDDVLVALRRIIRAIDLHSRKLMQDVGITGPQLLVLKVLSQSSPMGVGALARQVNLSQGTVTSILDRLERRQMVTRSRCLEDRRRVIVTLEAPGKLAMENAPPPLQQEFVDAFEALQPWEQLQILGSVERLASMMGAERIPAEPLLSNDILPQLPPTPRRVSPRLKHPSRSPAPLASEGEVE